MPSIFSAKRESSATERRWRRIQTLLNGVFVLAALLLPQAARAADCDGLKEVPVHDGREILESNADFFQFQTWFCSRSFADADAAKAAGAKQGVDPQVFVTPLIGVTPDKWTEWSAKLCGITALPTIGMTSQNYAELKAASRAIAKAWLECINSKSILIWFDLGGFPWEITVIYSQPQIGATLSVSGDDGCVAANHRPAPMPGWPLPPLMCIRMPDARVSVTLDGPAGKVSAELAPWYNMKASLVPNCGSEQDPMSDQLTRAKANPNYALCFEKVARPKVIACQAGDFGACNIAQTFRNLAISATQFHEAKAMCKKQNLPEASCPDAQAAAHALEMGAAAAATVSTTAVGRAF